MTWKSDKKYFGGKNPFDSLADDLMWPIFVFLPVKTILDLQLVDRNFIKVIKNNNFWIEIVQRDFGDEIYQYVLKEGEKGDFSIGEHKEIVIHLQKVKVRFLLEAKVFVTTKDEKEAFLKYFKMKKLDLYFYNEMESMILTRQLDLQRNKGKKKGEKNGKQDDGAKSFVRSCIIV